MAIINKKSSGFIAFIRNFNPTPINIAKAVGIITGGLFVFALVISLIGSLSKQNFGVTAPLSVSRQSVGGFGGSSYSPSYDQSESYQKGIAPIPPRDNFTPGADAEDFEVTEYNAAIETRSLDRTCKSVSELKAKSYVVFESADSYEHGCDYTFKVEHAHVAEVLQLVKDLGPKNLSENTYTIKRQLEDYSKESDILEKKKNSIDETLKNAIAAYDSIITLATNTKDVESLARIIESKIQMIERLTQERISINEQLDRIRLAKADQEDRLLYTYFRVNVYENIFVDIQVIKDSWKIAIKDFLRDINLTLQGVTVGLLAMLLFLFQYILYLFILLLVAKYGWRLAKYVWEI
ncbi:hypothetical protein HYT01_03275 [Candidatus Giovannonibacteria bacterium]|nr:hypothetical protein [Candidatus Giovannonibacteria bacterium]